MFGPAWAIEEDNRLSKLSHDQYMGDWYKGLRDTHRKTYGMGNTSVVKSSGSKSQSYWRSRQGNCGRDPKCLRNNGHEGSCKIFSENYSGYKSYSPTKKRGNYQHDPDQDEFYGHSGGGGVDWGDGPYY